ncbi:MAG: hypothetical protein CMM50_10300 [Rhodospirillaceae bacterium]|jgi:hypothetical protein|nr:hypothetical protein [Rhodospirillaceae bacterium]|tara:strand:+ start:228 stop:572 length:345 start_codon:yes stop_codon:yes gene_type:complete
MSRIVMTLTENVETSYLSPFFSKAKWLSVVETDTMNWWYQRNEEKTAAWVVRRICESRPHFLICGFIDLKCLEHAAQHDIDVRLGPGNAPAQDLVSRIMKLPRALDCMAASNPR